ncbi:hypothetical protein FRB94_014542 [Tulasnella sp. JGI-2019a]|nr:hypothetical protein FRB94_014542 [Tulasnella sp. JGI-2019a]
MSPIPPPAKVLVTGASGFIGARVCKTLLDKGYRVVGTGGLIEAAVLPRPALQLMVFLVDQCDLQPRVHTLSVSLRRMGLARIISASSSWMTSRRKVLLIKL